MRNLKQLALFIRLESKKLTQVRIEYQQARTYQSDQQKRLSELETYRLEYLQQIRTKVNAGAQANELIQYQNFVSNLDKACQQQVQMINQAVLVVSQRKQLFLTQQNKLDALQKYQLKINQKIQLHQSKQEQKLFDELALQSVLKSESDSSW